MQMVWTGLGLGIRVVGRSDLVKILNRFLSQGSDTDWYKNKITARVGFVVLTSFPFFFLVFANRMPGYPLGRRTCFWERKQEGFWMEHM